MNPTDALSFADGGDGLSGLVVGLVVGIAVVLIGFVVLPLALLPLEVLVLLVLLPGHYLLRLVGVVPWTIVERDGRGAVVHLHRVRGLRAALAYRDKRRAALAGGLCG